MSQDEAAVVFTIGVATVYRWVRLKRETGSLDPRPNGGGQPAAFDDDERELVKRVVAEKPDRTLADLTAEVCNRVKRTVSTSAVVRALKRLKLTLKKKSSQPASRIARTFRRAARSSSQRSR